MNGIALNAMLGPLVRHRFRDLHDATLGCCVWGDVLPADEADDGGDVDYLACVDWVNNEYCDNRRSEA